MLSNLGCLFPAAGEPLRGVRYRLCDIVSYCVTTRPGYHLRHLSPSLPPPPLSLSLSLSVSQRNPISRISEDPRGEISRIQISSISGKSARSCESVECPRIDGDVRIKCADRARAYRRCRYRDGSGSVTSGGIFRIGKNSYATLD